MPDTRPTAQRALAALVTATVATGTAAVTVPAMAHADPARCASTFNLFIPGTWETNEHADPSVAVGILKPIADTITATHGDRAEVYTLPYMARAFDNGKTYADSKSDARTKAANVLTDVASKCTRTKFTITGYSQGADAAGDLASDIGNGKGPIRPDRVLAVGLLADPGSAPRVKPSSAPAPQEPASPTPARREWASSPAGSLHLLHRQGPVLLHPEGDKPAPRVARLHPQQDAQCRTRGVHWRRK